MEDHEIVELYWQRAEKAIDETAAKYGAYCMRIAYNALNHSSDAEECVNDTYLGAWNAMPDARPKRLKAFLGKITRNIALTRLDYRHAKKRDSNLTEVLSEVDDCLVSASAEDVFDQHETLEIINAFLKELKPDDRRIFVLRYWYIEPIKEICARMEMSESKVKLILFRTRKKLHDYFVARGQAV